MTSVSTDPLHAIVRQELGHFLTLLLIVVSFYSDSSNMFNAIVIGSQLKFLVLILQLDYLIVFLAKLALEHIVHLFKFL